MGDPREIEGRASFFRGSRGTANPTWNLPADRCQDAVCLGLCSGCTGAYPPVTLFYHSNQPQQPPPPREWLRASKWRPHAESWLTFPPAGWQAWNAYGREVHRRSPPVIRLCIRRRCLRTGWAHVEVFYRLGSNPPPPWEMHMSPSTAHAVIPRKHSLRASSRGRGPQGAYLFLHHRRGPNVTPHPVHLLRERQDHRRTPGCG